MKERIEYFYEHKNGGSLKAKDLRKFIKNSYENKLQDHEDYKVDKQLSGKRVQVYRNDNNNHTVITHRGTSGFQDILTDAKMLLGFKNNNRFNHAKKIQKQAEEKYKDAKITTIGHSLGKQLAADAMSNNPNSELITVNGAELPFNNSKRKTNQTDIRSSADPVSILNKKNDITIKSKSLNPFTEHSSDILRRLPDNQKVGREI
jgi:hypothetical protein